MNLSVMIRYPICVELSKTGPWQDVKGMKLVTDR